MDPASLLTGRDVREAARAGRWTKPTTGIAPGYAQANLVVVPQAHAADFLLFCQRNARACPVLAVSDPGATSIPEVAADADLRTDLPRYRVWRDGEVVAEPDHVDDEWRADLVSFLIGCSFTFETALLRGRVPVRHVQLGTNVPMFRTNRPCAPAGLFRGTLVVSMRPLNPADAIRAIQITTGFPAFHGAPVHLGFPEQLGIVDLQRPDFGDPVPVHPGELPVFWACGVTPQVALATARLPFAITHSPGCMFVTDLHDETLC